MTNGKLKFKNRWDAIAKDLKLDAITSKILYDDLVFRYTNGRVYHGLNHIVDCIDKYNKIKHLLFDCTSVILALLYHDIVYNTRSSENELRSAEYMKIILTPTFDADKIDKVYRYILATKEHGDTSDMDLKYLLDIDMSILGSRQKDFMKYDRLIAQEYDWLFESYPAQRVKFLEKTLKNGPIFKTILFSKKYERQAQQNLKMSLNYYKS